MIYKSRIFYADGSSREVEVEDPTYIDKNGNEVEAEMGWSSNVLLPSS